MSHAKLTSTVLQIIFVILMLFVLEVKSVLILDLDYAYPYVPLMRTAVKTLVAKLTTFFMAVMPDKLGMGVLLRL